MTKTVNILESWFHQPPQLDRSMINFYGKYRRSLLAALLQRDLNFHRHAPTQPSTSATSSSRHGHNYQPSIPMAILCLRPPKGTTRVRAVLAINRNA
jgi:hypothetical protein